MEKNIKEKFIEMCKLVKINESGLFYDFNGFYYDNDFDYLTEDKDYLLLSNKMKNFIKLINSDHSLFDKDIETELWDMI